MHGLRLHRGAVDRNRLAWRLAAIAPRRGARVRVGDFAQRWLELKARTVEPHTLTGYRYALERHLLPELGQAFYELLTHGQVQRAVNALLDKRKRSGGRYAVESVRDWFRVFSNMTHDAIAELELGRDPTLRVTLPEPLELELEQALSPTEAPAVLEAMRRPRPGSHALCFALAYTGLRFCHASALQLGDVDTRLQLILVRRKQVRGRVGQVSRGKRAPAVVPMTAELVQVLEQHVARLARLGYPTGAGDWLFPSRRRGLRTPASLVNALRAAAAAAGIHKRVTPHSFRYWFNDMIRRAGVDPVTRKAMTGHVTDQMREHYSTVGIDERRAAIAALERLLLLSRPE